MQTVLCGNLIKAEHGSEQGYWTWLCYVSVWPGFTCMDSCMKTGVWQWEWKHHSASGWIVNFFDWMNNNIKVMSVMCCIACLCYQHTNSAPPNLLYKAHPCHLSCLVSALDPRLPPSYRWEFASPFGYKMWLFAAVSMQKKCVSGCCFWLQLQVL